MLKRFNLADKFYDLETEASFLATIYKSPPDQHKKITELLSPDIFSEANKNYYEQIIANNLDADDYFSENILKAEISSSLDELSKKLVGLKKKRLLADVTQIFLEELKKDNSDCDISVLVDSKLRQLSALKINQPQQINKLFTLSALIPPMIEKMKKNYLAVKENKVFPHILSGFNQLDRILGGLQPGLYLLGAPPGIGKTTFALQIAKYVSQSGHTSLFCSYEETLDKLALKCLCSCEKLDIKRFQDYLSSPEGLENAASKHIDSLKNLYLYQATIKTSINEIKEKVLHIFNGTKLKKCLIIIDYLQRASPIANNQTDNRYAIDQFIGELRDLSIELDSPILVISAQNRHGVGSGILQSFKESSGIEYGADVCMFLCEDSQRMVEPPARPLSLVIAKNRFGDIGKISLTFHPQIAIFHEK